MRQRPSPVVATAAVLVGTVALAGCAGTDPLPTATAAAYGPLELTSLMVLSPGGDHILGNIETVTTGPDGRARTVVIDGGAPLFPMGRRMVVDATDLRAAPFLGTTWLTGEPWRVVAGFADPEPGMMALGGRGTHPTDWNPVR